MAKKSFSNNSKSAAAAFFTTTPLLEQPPITAPVVVKEQTPLEMISVLTNTKTKPAFTIEANKKRKRDKRISVLVNNDEYAEFTQIATMLGYKNNDLLNRLMNEFVNANNK